MTDKGNSMVFQFSLVDHVVVVQAIFMFMPSLGHHAPDPTDIQVPRFFQSTCVMLGVNPDGNDAGSLTPSGGPAPVVSGAKMFLRVHHPKRWTF